MHFSITRLKVTTLMEEFLKDANLIDNFNTKIQYTVKHAYNEIPGTVNFTSL